MTTGSRDPDAATDLRASTLKIVAYILKLNLPQARWERVAEIIEAATEAAAADDLEGVRKAAGELMLVSPVRVIKGDGPATEPAGQKIFERANVLIDTLQSMRPPPAQDSGGKRP